MEIIKANNSNIDQLTELILFNKKAQSDFKGFLPRKDNYREALKAELLLRLEDKNYAYFLALNEDKRPIGIITANSYEWAGVSGKAGTLSNLFVDESYRGNGIARDLATRAIHWSKENGITALEVDVFIENTSAQKFWDSIGFEDTLTIKTINL